MLTQIKKNIAKVFYLHRNLKYASMTIRNNLKDNYVIALIMAFAIVLRFLGQPHTPPSLNWDEVSHGYNAYAILTTGRDEWGEIMPTLFRAYGDYKLPVYIYLTAVSEFFFGLSDFAVRLVSAVAGVAMVFFTYRLVNELFSHRNDYEQYSNHRILATIAAFLVAIEPWSLFLSRAAFEANLAVSFIVAGVYFFLRGISRPQYFVISALLLGLSVWTYNSARVFVPLLLVVIWLIHWRAFYGFLRSKKKPALYYVALIVVFFVPMFYQLLTNTGQARYEEVAILDIGAINQINEARNSSEFSPLVSRLVYNKGTYLVQRFSKNYFSHFSPTFLFLEGGDHYQFNVPGKGLLYLVNLPFFYLGLLLLIFGLLRKFSAKKTWYLLLAWALLAPIPSSLTREAPHALRAITLLPLPMIFVSLGFVSFVEWSKEEIGRKMSFKVATRWYLHLPRAIALDFAYFLFLIIFLEAYFVSYLSSYRDNYSWAWQYGYKQAVEYVENRYHDYDKIIVTKKYGEPHEFFLFYGAAGGTAPWPWKTADYRNDPKLNRFYQSEWYWVDGFDKLYFVNDWQIARGSEIENLFVMESGGVVDCINSRCLLVTSLANAPLGWHKLGTINFLDGKPAFEMYENK